jgi:hypothetical protein
MQTDDAPFAEKAVVVGSPDRVIPAPFKPHDVGPADRVGESGTGTGANEPHLVMLAQSRNQRGKECIVPSLDAVSQ